MGKCGGLLFDRIDGVFAEGGGDAFGDDAFLDRINRIFRIFRIFRIRTGEASPFLNSENSVNSVLKNGVKVLRRISDRIYGIFAELGSGGS